VLDNDGPTRVWIHQNPDNSGWAVCLNPYNSFIPVFYDGINGTNYENPGNVQISDNSAACPANGMNDVAPSGGTQCGTNDGGSQYGYFTVNFGTSGQVYCNAGHTSGWTSCIYDTYLMNCDDNDLEGPGPYTHYVAWVDNEYAARNFLHQHDDGDGWAICFDPSQLSSVPSSYQSPGNWQVNTNDNPC
jgi:hypothetical protein